MTHAEIYEMAVGGFKLKQPINTEEVEVQEALAGESARLHKQWLDHPITQELLDNTKEALDDSVGLAIAQACKGQNDFALRNLIKAKAFKEVINYVKRNTESASI